jgi:hypothetical protein
VRRATVEDSRNLLEKFYRQGLHRDLWFQWLGKPLLIAPAKGLDASITNFFTLRESWAWTDPRGWFQDGRDKWPWLDHTPQKFGWHVSPQVPEEICVEVALPRAALGLTGAASTVNFKWADNLQQTGEASDFTLNGDAAPNDRFNYSARLGGFNP